MAVRWFTVLRRRAGACAAALAAAAMIAEPAAAASPSAAPAASAAPVQIDACRGGINSIELVEIANYDVTLRNTSRVAADEVKFHARYGRHEKRATFDLHDTFPPGVAVQRHVHRTVNGGLFGYTSDQNDCFVDYVHFTDGTSWTAPSR